MKDKFINLKLKSISFLDYEKIDYFHLSGVFIYEKCLKNFLEEFLGSISQDDISNLFRGSIRINNTNEEVSDYDFWLIDETKLRNIFIHFDIIDFEKMIYFYPQEYYNQYIKHLNKKKINQEISFEEYASAQLENLKEFISFVRKHFDQSRSIICIYDY